MERFEKEGWDEDARLSSRNRLTGTQRNMLKQDELTNDREKTPELNTLRTN